MTKEDLNRQFGGPEKQKPITPLDLIAAAHLIRDYCNSVDLEECNKCIFGDSHAKCHILRTPEDWDLSDAESKAMDWIDKQFPSGHALYLDTDKYTDE